MPWGFRAAAPRAPSEEFWSLPLPQLLLGRPTETPACSRPSPRGARSLQSETFLQDVRSGTGKLDAFLPFPKSLPRPHRCPVLPPRAGDGRWAHSSARRPRHRVPPSSHRAKQLQPCLCWKTLGDHGAKTPRHHGSSQSGKHKRRRHPTTAVPSPRPHGCSGLRQTLLPARSSATSSVPVSSAALSSHLSAQPFYSSSHPISHPFYSSSHLSSHPFYSSSHLSSHPFYSSSHLSSHPFYSSSSHLSSHPFYSPPISVPIPSIPPSIPFPIPSTPSHLIARPFLSLPSPCPPPPWPDAHGAPPSWAQAFGDGPARLPTAVSADRPRQWSHPPLISAPTQTEAHRFSSSSCCYLTFIFVGFFSLS
ncbi:uncharacterized protein LOC128078269 [Tympanuchus pallidicinctus]|uniref:uncharacterized protein LOC128078269 n=1 Tax=Tympanuchus pallidicinctus TaxID=109042 RepID=UPI002286FD39|nr:uncharacterized protein LOC128078269 [Tympanuchus pallidicinctus]